MWHASCSPLSPGCSSTHRSLHWNRSLTGTHLHARIERCAHPKVPAVLHRVKKKLCVALSENVPGKFHTVLDSVVVAFDDDYSTNAAPPGFIVRVPSNH